MAPVGIRRVLVVDDDPQVSEIMAAVMRLVCDEVVIVGTLGACFSIIRTKAFALVLLDLILPDSKPEDTLKSIPDILAAGVPRVVCVTAIDMGDPILSAAQANGAELVISKDNGFTPKLRALFARPS